MSNHYGEREKKGLALKFVFKFIVLFSIVLLALFLVGSYCTEKTYVAKVCEKHIDIFNNGSKLYVAVEFNGDFKDFIVNNSLLKWRWNSSEDYEKIELNKTYSFTVTGWRLPLFNLYENIIEFKEVY